MSAAGVVQVGDLNLGLTAPVFRDKFADLLAGYLAAADLLGRYHVLRGFESRTGDTAELNTLTAAFGDSLEIGTSFDLPFDGAIKRIRNLTSYTRLAYDGLKARYRMQAFTIAGVSDVGLIERIQKALGDTMANGGTVEDFRSEVNKLTSDAGAQQIADLHVNTVFQTNVQKAYQNGRFEQLRDPAVVVALPYWVYSTAGDARVRPAHAALEGFTAKQDDPVWRRIYPPCGYNCRCTVYAIGADEAPEEAAKPGLERIPAAAASVPDPGFGGIPA